jgi:hypothetical protein
MGLMGRLLLGLYGLRFWGHLLLISTICLALSTPPRNPLKSLTYPFMSRENHLVSIDLSSGIFQIGSIGRSDFYKRLNPKRDEDIDVPPSSVIEKLLLVSPLSNGKRYFSFCSLVPNLARTSISSTLALRGRGRHAHISSIGCRTVCSLRCDYS